MSPQNSELTFTTLPQPRGRSLGWSELACGALARLQALLHLRKTAGSRRSGAARRNRSPGRVVIVGAGPGSADLLTLRALRCLQQADVVVYDKLVGADILAAIPSRTLKIFAGKSPGCHNKSQDEINALLVQHAKRGAHVVRLKGGDPFIFGRGGEEQQFLHARGISTQIVPGVTAAAGCAAAAGIPLTHRGTAQAVTFLTGHAQAGEPDLPWRALVQGGQTLVVYMGVATAPTIARRLLQHGADPQTPVAVVENGTLAREVIGRGRLGDLPGLLARHVITGPAVIIIGAVAALPRPQTVTPPNLHLASEGALI